MKNPCDDCPIEENLEFCCHSNPETGVSQLVQIGRVTYQACPNLDNEGHCRDYQYRPEACREYQCHKFYELDVVDLME